ncbi:hypothetical protein C0993_008853 [Termitomyces sp. T159_Od127]|nr:hypothetical protein C0993_008853 [Termitomyces sp. T159_Od127]
MSKAGTTPNGSSREISTSADDLLALGNRHVTKGVGRLTEGILAKGQGSYVEYEDGKKLLDFSTGIGVTGLGLIAFHRPYLELVERLLPVMPHPSLDSFFFWNSGSEAVEAAIKLARVSTGKQNIISMQGSFHGRTYGAMAVTNSKTIYSEGVLPLMPGVFSIPYPYWHQYGLSPSTPSATLVAQSLYQLELLLAQRSAPRDTAAVIVEPLLGEGGYVQAPPEFLQGLRAICDKHDILLIVDEVQCGFARTGKYFNIEYSGVRPDIMVIAKGLANGFPLSGVVSRKELTDKMKPGSMGGTYAGNAVSCAAAVAVADAFKEENILANVQARYALPYLSYFPPLQRFTRSKELIAGLQALRADPDVAPCILDVRGTGLMVAVEFTSPSGPGADFDPLTRKESPKNLASRVSKACLARGMIILTTSAYEVVRFIPPLNITAEDLKKGVDIFSEAVKQVVREG